MEPITGGAASQVQHNMFQEAEQQIQKSNDQISDFEKLRSKLEETDALSNPAQIDAMNKMNQTPQVDQANAAQQTQQTQQVSGVEGVPEVKNMDELQGMVNNIRDGQKRLNEIISQATSGKTYSPSEMIGMQAEVSKITTELEMATKVVENFVSGIKQTLNLQL